MSVIPLGDASRRPGRWPAVTALIIATNIAVFAAEIVGGQPFVARWSVVPARLFAEHDWITIFTAMYMHGGWSHIVGNMIFLWAFGPEIEDSMGSLRYLIFYLAGGVVAMLAQVVADPHSTVPNLGASGAIAAVMGAFLVTFPKDRIRSAVMFGLFVRIRFIPAALFTGVWFLLQLVSFGSVAKVQTGGVAYLAHIGGFIFGAVVARFSLLTGRTPVPDPVEP